MKGFMLKFRDIKELDELMSPEKKTQAQESFKKYYPEWTPEIMCTSQDHEDGGGEKYLVYVDLSNFD